MVDSPKQSGDRLPADKLQGTTASAAAALSDALAAARARGTAWTQALLLDPVMLTVVDFSALVGVSDEAIGAMERRHEVLGLSFDQNGVRYPRWQLSPDGKLLPGLDRIFAVLGDDPWRVFRFLLQHHNELGGKTALAALRQGQVERVLGAAENIASGAYS